MDRYEALARRVAVQQLDRPPAHARRAPAADGRRRVPPALRAEHAGGGGDVPGDAARAGQGALAGRGRAGGGGGRRERHGVRAPRGARTGPHRRARPAARTVRPLAAGARPRLVLPDRARHKGLWPTIGRPGAVLVGADLVGTWRPKASGKKLALTLDAWQPVPPTVRALVDEQAERLAAHRDVTLTGVVRT